MFFLNAVGNQKKFVQIKSEMSSSARSAWFVPLLTYLMPIYSMSAVVSHTFALFKVAFGISSALKSFSYLFTLRANSFNGTGKDFDIYYVPLFLLGGAGSLSTFFQSGVKTLAGVESDEEDCLNSALLFTHFLAGTSLLQIALNWMKVAGES